MTSYSSTGSGKPPTLDLESASSFPALGASPAPKGASWGQLRNRLAGPTSATAPHTSNAASLAKNSFAVLSEDAVSVSTSAPLNFKAMLTERIEQDQAEKDKIEYEVDDPLEMTDEQLLESGWAILQKRPGQVPAFVEAAVDAAAGAVAENEEDDSTTAVQGPEEPDLVIGIPREIAESGDSHRFLAYACRGKAVGADPWCIPEMAAEFALQVAARRKDTAFMRLLDRKRMAMRAPVPAAVAQEVV